MSRAYLAHHGIKGQKWGVRRYQNEDGTWTAAGKERYGKAGASKTTQQVKETEGTYAPSPYSDGTTTYKKIRVSNENSGDNDRKKALDAVPEDDWDYDIAEELNKTAAHFARNVKKGKEEALKILDDDLKDYSYELILTTDTYDDGEEYTSYYLEVMGNTTVYQTGGAVYDDGDYYYDDDYFYKK